MATVLVNTGTDGAVLIPAPGPGKAIQIDSWDLTADGAAVVTLKSGATTLWKTDAMLVAGGGSGIVLSYSPTRLLVGGPNTAITIGLSAAVNVAGTLDYHLNDVLS